MSSLLSTQDLDNSILEAEKIADKVIKWPWQMILQKHQFWCERNHTDYKMKWDADWFLRAIHKKY